MSNSAQGNIIQLEDGWNNVIKTGVSFLPAIASEDAVINGMHRISIEYILAFLSHRCSIDIFFHRRQLMYWKGHWTMDSIRHLSPRNIFGSTRKSAPRIVVIYCAMMVYPFGHGWISWTALHSLCSALC